VLTFTGVTKRYPEGGEVLSGVGFELSAGDLAFLTGASGAGKSTLLRLIPVIDRPTRGQIILDGVNLAKLPEREIPSIRRKLGLIFQDFRLLHDRTVFDNVALPLVIAGFGHAEIARRVRAALDKVHMLNREKRYPAGLSGGEQQRVGIARAIVHKPQLILADEPTGNLDPDLSVEIMSLFHEFSQVGVAVLIASHDLGLVSSMGGRLLHLSEGRLIEEAR
jgi:cell division transport system ATP-binding protein